VRWLGSLWASPNTLLGLLLVATAGKARRQRGLHYVAELDSAFDRWFEKAGFAAITLGDVVIYRPMCFREPTIRHELEHIAQYHLWGPAFLPAYLICELFARLRGSRNAFESAAREAAGQKV
jgi:hypothetical protein